MPNVRPGGVNPIVTLTPLLARPGSHRLAICAESREAFASVVLELIRQWERVEISEPSQLPISGWWHGSGRVRNKVAARSGDRVRSEMAVTARSTGYSLSGDIW
jgi:hypothetical protein